MSIRRDRLGFPVVYNGRYQRLDGVRVYTDGVQIVVEGNPPDETTDPEGVAHNCDVMGCGLEHVLYRAPLPPSGGVALGYEPPEPEPDQGPSEALLRARERQREAGNDAVYPFWVPDE
jgi:hypothetical protein